jgi:hypothetical protein
MTKISREGINWTVFTLTVSGYVFEPFIEYKGFEV